jgi:hypothetical protein
MSMEPIQRRMNIPAAPTALNAAQYMLDDITGLSFIQLTRANTLLDMYNDPDPGGVLTFTDEIHKNSISTGRNFFTSAMSTASAGRAAVGPIRLAQGQFQMSSRQTAGALTRANAIVIKFANGF